MWTSQGIRSKAPKQVDSFCPIVVLTALSLMRLKNHYSWSSISRNCKSAFVLLELFLAIILGAFETILQQEREEKEKVTWILFKRCRIHQQKFNFRFIIFCNFYKIGHNYCQESCHGHPWLWNSIRELMRYWKEPQRERETWETLGGTSEIPMG